jgi:two-component system KDP operon response regulator KdpE
MRPKGKRILVVDDEVPIQRILRKNLTVNGYDVLVADNGRQAVEMTRIHQPDLILLDICMPGGIDGVEVCIQVREFAQMPIIILSAVSEERQKVKALDKGADDYLTKPFSNDELQARVRACLRRVGVKEINESGPDTLMSDDGKIYIVASRRQVRVSNQDIRLTPTEFELLRYLMLHTGKVLTHRVLLRAVWGPEYGEEADYLRVYIRQLRRKVEPEPSRPRYIVTEPGIGYVFRSSSES